ncbi:MAG: hypothetical protein QG575_1498 [Euryarchaeota archaeon]|nr:hypothetical protein [Euryarchaeota archaeon]
MRGHIKLFTLQMNLDRARQPKNTAATEDACFGTCRNEASSLQHIFLPSLKIMSGR